jgi:hypothetical protein
MYGDNFGVTVCSEGRVHFDAAVRIAWASAAGGKATHYLTPIPAHNCIECCGSGKGYALSLEQEWETVSFRCKECSGSGKKPAKSGIVLLWHEDVVHGVPALALPYPLTVDAAINFLDHWLNCAEFPPQPDHDGSNGRGFIVTTGDFWGHVEGSHYAFVGIYPNWQMYGK